MKEKKKEIARTCVKGEIEGNISWVWLDDETTINLFLSRISYTRTDRVRGARGVRTK